MYQLSAGQWNPYVGCAFYCSYCKSSFQAQLKRWAKKHCAKCYDFCPHEHPERLTQKLPMTGYMQFVFACSSGDIAFCEKNYLMKIVARMESEPATTFLLQSKWPLTFRRVDFPKNVILGTTLETNRDDLYKEISNAPRPSSRYISLLDIRHPLKMITIEPVIDFDKNVMIDWVTNINPCMVWLGYDSRQSRLPEPSLEKVKNLYWELGQRGFTVILKKTRKACWENANVIDRLDIKSFDKVYGEAATQAEKSQ